MTQRKTPVVASDSGTLSGGSLLIPTGVTDQSKKIDVALGVQDPGADTKVAARLVWDDSAGEYYVEIVEQGTSVNPTVKYDIYLGG